MLFLEKCQLTYISLEAMGRLFAMSAIITLKRKRLLAGASHLKHSWIPRQQEVLGLRIEADQNHCEKSRFIFIYQDESSCHTQQVRLLLNLCP